jgi:hypothetical protein
MASGTSFEVWHNGVCPEEVMARPAHGVMFVKKLW